MKYKDVAPRVQVERMMATLKDEILSLISRYGLNEVGSMFDAVKEDMLALYIGVLERNGFMVSKQVSGAAEVVSQLPVATQPVPIVAAGPPTAIPAAAEEAVSQPLVSSPAAAPIPAAEETPATKPYTKRQREKERQKKEEVQGTGQDVRVLLTVENVRTWLAEGRSYAWIAREKIGCKQELISQFARLNGLHKSKPVRQHGVNE